MRVSQLYHEFALIGDNRRGHAPFNSLPIIAAMSAMTSLKDMGFCGRLERLGRHLTAGMLMALPLGGLVFFFEATRPAQLYGEGAVAAQLSTPSFGMAGLVSARPRQVIARLKGVSAELHENSAPQLAQLNARAFSVADAGGALGRAAIASLKPGVEAEFVTKDHRIVAVRVVSREAIIDQAVPDNAHIMEIAPASTAATVSFVWGPWLYRVEVRDKGTEPAVVVQNVL
jgi:hypothetical protein